MLRKIHSNIYGIRLNYEKKKALAVIWEKRIEIGDDQLAEKLHEMRKEIALLEQIIVTTTVARIRSHVERK